MNIADADALAVGRHPKHLQMYVDTKLLVMVRAGGRAQLEHTQPNIVINTNRVCLMYALYFAISQ